MPRRERNIYKRKDGRFEARFIKGGILMARLSMVPYTHEHMPKLK